jgi:BMFP domain-containing protein YqiC
MDLDALRNRVAELEARLEKGSNRKARKRTKG